MIGNATLGERWIYAGRAALIASLLASVLFVFGTKRHTPLITEAPPANARENSASTEYVNTLIARISKLNQATNRPAWSGSFVQVASSKEQTGRDGASTASVRNPFAEKQIDLMQIGNVYRIVVDGEDYAQGDIVGEGIEITSITPLWFSVKVAGKTARFDIQ